MGRVTRSVARSTVCGEKVKYHTRENAEKSNPSIYLCPYCRKWHGSRSEPDSRHFSKLLREEQDTDPKLYLFSWRQTDLQDVYNRLISNGALVKFICRNGRYEIRIK